MSVKDILVKRFIVDFVIAGQEIMDKPGFIATTVTGNGKKYHIRDLILPEIYFEELENQITDKYKEKGRQALYSIGKKFGYRYALISAFPTLGKDSERKVSIFINLFVKYVETIYANKLEYKLDLKNKTTTLTMKDYTVCRHNGKGYILTEGAIAGVISYILNDKTIEGAQISCQGRGDKECELICGPSSYLEKNGITHLKETRLNSLDLDQKYVQYNQFHETRARYSLLDMIKSNVYSKEGGIIKYHDFRLVFFEASLLYLIEKELTDIGAQDIIYRVSKEAAHELIKHESNRESFIIDFLSSLGWGEINYIKRQNNPEVICNFYPWTEYISDHHFLTLKGILAETLLPNKKNIEDKVFLAQGYINATLF